MMEEINYGFEGFAKNDEKEKTENFYSELSNFKTSDHLKDIFNNTYNHNFLDELDDTTLTDNTIDPLSDTKKITSFNNPEFQSALERIENQNPKEAALDLAITKEKVITLEESFVNCAVLGFIVLFAGFGWLFALLHYIAY